MATLSELRENPQAVRRFFIFGAVLLVALGWLVLPSWLAHHGVASANGPSARAGAGKKPAPGTDVRATAVAPVAVPVAPAPGPVVVAAPDPFAGLIGRWAGQARVSEARGNCALLFEAKRAALLPAAFDGFSTLSCVPNVFELIAGGGKTRKEIEKAEADAGKRQPTSASFAGEAKDGAIEFKAVQNIGVAANPDGCAMLSLTLRPFAEGVSVKWAETGKEDCAGGEMVMTRR